MPNPAEVVWLEFPGAVVTKRRPAVVVSSNVYHSQRPDVIVGLLTSQITKAVAPTDHLLHDWQSAGLRVPSAFRAFLATIPQTALISTLGQLSVSDWRAVQKCLHSAISLT
jgi:mRNA interferase MazF